MLKPNCNEKRVLAAIANLEHNEDFKTLVAWLDAELQAMREENDTAMNTYLIMNQGGCQAVSAVLKTIRTARDAVKAIEFCKSARQGAWS